MKKKNKRSDTVSPRFSFIDILFSTIGTIIFIIAVNIIFIASYQGLRSESDSQLEEIEKTSSIFTPRRVQYDIYGSPIWLNPILILLDKESLTAHHRGIDHFENINELKEYMKKISITNCILNSRRDRRRYSFILGLLEDSYKLSEDLSIYALNIENYLRDEYPDSFYPVNISKIPIIKEDMDIIEKIWEETRIEIHQ